MSIRFVGLDLAWSRRRTSAAVVLRGVQGSAVWQDHCDNLGTDGQIMDFLYQAVGRHAALVAIHAPLIVPNALGARPVNTEISRLFGPYQAGCYPANRGRGITRGEHVVSALVTNGFSHNPYVRRKAATRSFFEVHPHPATTSLFRLQRTLKYKARRGRSIASRRIELQRLCDLILSLANSQPAMLSNPTVARRDIKALRGANLKRHEDLLDAAICAYTAYYSWHHGPRGYQVFGSMTSGYILVPISGWMRERLGMSLKPTAA